MRIINKKNKKTLVSLIIFLTAGSVFQINEIIKIVKSDNSTGVVQKASVNSAANHTNVKSNRY